MSFPFLPNELVLEVIRLATQPQYDDEGGATRRPSYAAGLSLALVSHAFRRATMPSVLHTVVLATSEQTLAFIDAIKLQNDLHASSSRLALNYPKLVRRFWSAECIEALEDHPPDYYIDYAALYPVLRGADVLAFTFESLHLLYNGLSSPAGAPAQDWTCQRLVLTGSRPRWKPLTSSLEGSICLSRVTHLSLWYDDPWTPAEELPARWGQDIPLSSLSNLTHLAISLPPDPDPTSYQSDPAVYTVPMRILVYVVDSDPSIIRDWLRSENSLSHGVVLSSQARGRISESGSRSLEWDSSFVMGDVEAAWAEADRARATSS